MFGLNLFSFLPVGSHSGLYLLVFWAGAFVSLAWALLGLNFFWNVIDSDSECLSLGKEGVLAVVASAIEGIGTWALAAFVPAGLARGILAPLVVVWLLYRVAHYENWGTLDAFTLIVFQVAIVLTVVAGILGYFQLALMIVAACISFLVVYAAIVKGL